MFFFSEELQFVKATCRCYELGLVMKIFSNIIYTSYGCLFFPINFLYFPFFGRFLFYFGMVYGYVCVWDTK